VKPLRWKVRARAWPMPPVLQPVMRTDLDAIELVFRQGKDKSSSRASYSELFFQKRYFPPFYT
jgi:hypothetical protein